MSKMTGIGDKKNKRPAIKDLPAADAKTRNVKGGFLGSIGKDGTALKSL